MKTYSPIHVNLLTVFAMLAFAGNSLLCRMALKHTSIDAMSFTSIRLMSGAMMLWLIVWWYGGAISKSGNWAAALALFVYAACFSIAYVNLPTGTGALLLFGAVQITMISYGLWTGERLRRRHVIGVMMALAGLIGLLLPGLATPPLQGSLLMLIAGMAWGIYSLLGRGVDNALRATGANFLRAVPFAILLSLMTRSDVSLDGAGVGYAVCSGAIASGIGYTLWYYALPNLQATHAAMVQLSVPILAAIGAILFLHEPMTLRVGLAAIAVLGGIALAIGQRQPPPHLRQILRNPNPVVQNPSCDRPLWTMSPRVKQKLTWSLWLITWFGLLAGFVARQWYEGVVWFSVVQLMLFIYLERFNLMAFPVQVRLAYVAWVAIGTYVPYMGQQFQIQNLTMG